MGFFSDLSGATGARLAGEARADAQNREGISLGALSNAFGQAQPFMVAARDAWNPVTALGQNYNQAGNVLMSSLGVGDRSVAQNAFTASPGYAWSVDQATDAAARRANSLGMAPSGNTLTALTTLGSNLANQEYANWQNRLMNVAQMGQSATTAGAAGLSGANTNLANFNYGYGKDEAGIVQQTGQAVQNSMGAEAAARGAGAANIAGLGINALRAFAGPAGTFMGGGYGGFSGSSGARA